MVVGHRERRVIGIALPENRTVLAVVGDAPEASFGCDERLVSVIVVGEGFGRMSKINLVSCGRDEVFGLFAVRGSLRKSRVCFEIGESASGGVIEEAAAEIIGAEAESRVLVDRDRRIRIGFAAHRRVAGGGALRILIEVVRRVG